MRYLLSVFLTLCLYCNAAHALASGVHEAAVHGGNPVLAWTAETSAHHHHGDDHAALDADELAASHGDHNHAHPPLLSLIPGETAAPAVHARRLPARFTREALVSVSPPRLERPPRTSRA